MLPKTDKNKIHFTQRTEYKVPHLRLREMTASNQERVQTTEVYLCAGFLSTEMVTDFSLYFHTLSQVHPYQRLHLGDVVTRKAVTAPSCPHRTASSSFCHSYLPFILHIQKRAYQKQFTFSFFWGGEVAGDQTQSQHFTFSTLIIFATYLVFTRHTPNSYQYLILISPIQL